MKLSVTFMVFVSNLVVHGSSTYIPVPSMSTEIDKFSSGCFSASFFARSIASSNRRNDCIGLVFFISTRYLWYMLGIVYGLGSMLLYFPFLNGLCPSDPVMWNL